MRDAGSETWTGTAFVTVNAAGLLSRRRIVVLVIVWVVMLGSLLIGAVLAGATSWSAGTYNGHGTGVWPKNSVTLVVATTGKQIPTYSFSIDTLCGEKTTGVESARETEIWPFTSHGSPAIQVSPSGAFASTQRGSLTVSAIPALMAKPEPGTYKFTVSGTLHASTLTGHLTLEIQTENGKYFCTDTNSPFEGTRAPAKG